ncbi:hypothetical protein ACHAQH_008589 [Verticillium albo-atrum]
MSNYIASFNSEKPKLRRLLLSRNGQAEGFESRHLPRHVNYLFATVVYDQLGDSDISYLAPNGASMRPLSEFQTKLVKEFKWSNVVVYAIPEGSPLPDDLIMVHEDTDHYSLQPAVEMPLKDLDKKITRFLEAYATVYSQAQWLAAFKTDNAYEASSVGPSSSSSQAASYQPEWTWSEEYGSYYSIDENGQYVWQPETEGQQASSSSKRHKKR